MLTLKGIPEEVKYDAGRCPVCGWVIWIQSTDICKALKGINTSSLSNQLHIFWGIVGIPGRELHQRSGHHTDFAGKLRSEFGNQFCRQPSCSRFTYTYSDLGRCLGVLCPSEQNSLFNKYGWSMTVSQLSHEDNLCDMGSSWQVLKLKVVRMETMTSTERETGPWLTFTSIKKGIKSQVLAIWLCTTEDVVTPVNCLDDLAWSLSCILINFLCLLLCNRTGLPPHCYK